MSPIKSGIVILVPMVKSVAQTSGHNDTVISLPKIDGKIVTLFGIIPLISLFLRWGFDSPLLHQDCFSIFVKILDEVFNIFLG